MLSFERNNQIMQRARLPPGFRFHPTDEELVGYYLKRKILGRPFHFQAISEIDIYKFAPWDLPERSCLRSNDLEWYFFCPRDRKYASGSRANRATGIGYWKTTGKDRTVRHNSEVIGMKKTLVFHTGKAPHGIRTDWVMHEYRLHDKKLVDAVIFQDAYVLCRIYEKSGPGPKNGEQYGGPFNEEEWNDVEVDEFELSICKISEHSDIFEKCTLEQCKSSKKLQNAKSEEYNGSSSIPADKDKENSIVLSRPSIGDASCMNGDEIYTGLEDIFPCVETFDENAHLSHPSIGDASCMNGDEIYTGLEDIFPDGDEIYTGLEDIFSCVETFDENAHLPFSLLDFDLEDGGFVEMNDLLPPTESNFAMNANLSYDTQINDPLDSISSILKSDTSATDS